MTEEASELRYAVRFTVVIRYLGQIGLALALLTVPPIIVALFFREFSAAARYGGVVAILAVSGWGATRVGAPARVQSNEALVIIALAFLLAPALMTFPMMDAGLSPVDAFFEAVSGVTTTGLTTLDYVEDRTRSFLFTRAWMQWYGGLGFVAFFAALLLRPGAATKSFASAGRIEDDLAGNTRARARTALAAYALLGAAACLVFFLFTGEFFVSLLYALTSVSTGGFAPHDDGLAAFGAWPVQTAVFVFSFAGAVSLETYRSGYRGKWRDIVGDAELRMLVVFVLAAFAALTGLMLIQNGGDWRTTLSRSPFLAVSAQTTTGFSTFNVSELDQGSKLVVVFSMVIGGAAGSTAGGVKVMRVIWLYRLLRRTVIRTSVPKHAVVHMRGGGPDGNSGLESAFLVVTLFLLTILLSWFAFIAAGYDALDSLFEVASATGTVGLTVGVTGHELSTPLKIVLCVDMLFGRLEVFAWLVLMYPKTWIGRRT